jgi:ketosteroid isomerase-like protein
MSDLDNTAFAASAITEAEVLEKFDQFLQALKKGDLDALKKIYSERYMLVRPDGSVLNKQQVLEDLREQGLRFHSIDLKGPIVRIVGSAGVLTAEIRTVSSRNGQESQAHFRLIAVYAQEGDAIRLVHFQSTMLS